MSDAKQCTFCKGTGRDFSVDGIVDGVAINPREDACIVCGGTKWVQSMTEPTESTLDNCELCGGRNGGVPGNENVIEGVVVCDYCSATLLLFDQAKRRKATPASHCIR